MPADETFDVGVDTRTAVNDKDYQVPFRFNGTIDKLTFNLGPPQLAEDGRAEDPGSRRQSARLRLGNLPLIESDLVGGVVQTLPVNETSPKTLLRKILAFAAVVEVATGFVLMIDPAIVIALLLGVEVSGAGSLLGRCFGIALLALGVACWPGRQRAESDSPAFRAMLIYNVLIALYLAYLGTVGTAERRAVVAGCCAARGRGAVADLDVAQRVSNWWPMARSARVCLRAGPANGS